MSLPHLLLLLVSISRLIRGFGKAEQEDLDVFYSEDGTMQNEFQDVAGIILSSADNIFVKTCICYSEYLSNRKEL